jgi:hypothetical protein
VIGFADRRSSDIDRKFDAVPVIAGQVSIIVSHSAHPELVILLVNDIGRRRAVVAVCRTSGSGNSSYRTVWAKADEPASRTTGVRTFLTRNSIWIRLGMI